MIRPLRDAHRRTLTVLAVLVPVVFAAGLLARQPVPAVNGLPATLRSQPPAGFTTVTTDEDAWDGLALRTTWLTAEPYRLGETPRHAVALRFLEDPGLPDVLVYWSESAEGTALPLDAHLLGSIGDGQERSWVLPEGSENGGFLILYSLARQEMVASTALPPDYESAP